MTFAMCKFGPPKPAGSTHAQIYFAIILIIFDQVHSETQRCQGSKSDFEANYLFLQKKIAK